VSFGEREEGGTVIGNWELGIRWRVGGSAARERAVCAEVDGRFPLLVSDNGGGEVAGFLTPLLMASTNGGLWMGFGGNGL
jgi:hypothetical protein